jgi:hypothetical protein
MRFINFGYHITIWFPDLASMVDTTRLANRPEAIQQIQSDPEKAAGIIQNQHSLPNQATAQYEQQANAYGEPPDVIIDPADITLND